MKLEEAASILGVSLEDITIDGLKQTYKKLALAWDPEKCKDQNSKTKYFQISEAYKKLNSVMEGTDGYRGDDSHEIAAFMRMFMDMVGISESDSIPAAMTFGMMFGANQNAVDEWSTDDDGDGDYDDDEDGEDDGEDCDDEDEYIPDEYFDEYPAMGSAMGGAIGGAGPLPMQMPMPPNMHPHPASHHMGSIHAAMKGKLNQPPSSATAASWEPQVKQYSNMNLKDQLNQQRMQMQQGEPEDNSDAGEQELGEETEADRERKLKLAKKRAEKRKKQKEKDKKKTKESASNSSATNDDTLNTRDFVDCDQLDPEHLNKLIRLHTDHIITELMHSVTNGQLGKVNQILSYDFAEEVPEAVGKEMIALLKKDLPTTPVLHHCITNLSRVNAAAAAGAPGAGGDACTAAYNTAMFTALAARRLEVARYLLNFTQPVFELGTVDAAGLSVLHQAIASGDLKIAQLVLRSITQGPEDRKTNLNVNSRCHRQGWAPIHYAVERADLEAVKLLVQSGANVQCTMATDKRQTPMELARQKMKGASAVVKAALQAIVEELLVAIEKSKSLKESESKSKKADAHGTAGDAGNKSSSKDKSAKEKEKEKKPKVAPEVTPAKATPALVPVAAATPVVASSSDKKKKKKDKAPDSTAQAAPQPAPEPVAPPLPVPPITKTPTQAPLAVTPGPVSAKNAKKNAKKNAAAAASAVPAAPQPTINAQAEMSVSSRDEMVDRLLAMGFRELDCLNAISLYGTDVDQAISWLCDRPAVATPAAAPTPTRPLEAETNKTAESVSTAAPMTLAAAMAAGAAMSSTGPAPSSAAKLQKEKEELRRINRAWNQKAEEEKRKAEAQKKQAELEKQQELLLQKQQQELLRQQQAQQEYIYQQHLQQQQVQYLAMQQQMQSQQQTYFPSWGAQQSGPMYGMGGADGSATAQSMVQQQYSNHGAASNTSFPVGSLQHMTTMLGAPQHSSAVGGSTGVTSGSGFGAHPSIVAASSAGGHSAPASSLQTLSGAMALAMDPAALHAHSHAHYGATSAHTSIPSLSIGDAMAMSYNNSHSHGGQAPSAAQQSSLLFGSSLDSGRLSSSFDGFTSGGADVYGDLPLNDPLVDGALELSAVAKPFVPRFGPSTGTNAGSASSTSSVLSNSPGPVHNSPMLSSMLAPPPPALSAAFGSSLSGSSLGGLNLGAGLGTSPWGSGVSLGMDVKINPSTAESKISSYLSNLLPSELNLDEDNYEYGDASDIIPDLDSFLLNDN